MACNSISSDEINYLVYRYIQEAGYTHSAYLFAGECRLFDGAALDTGDVPPAALITLLHKGLLYTEAELCAPDTANSATNEPVERHLTDSLTLIEALQPHSRSTQAKIVCEKRSLSSSSCTSTAQHNGTLTMKEAKDEPCDHDVTMTQSSSQHQKNAANVNNNRSPSMEKPAHGGSAGATIGAKLTNGNPTTPPYPNKNKLVNGVSSTTTGGTTPNHHHKHSKYQNDSASGPTAAKRMNSSATTGTKIGKECIRYLKGHESEVFICAWSPKTDILASGSGDSTARLWYVDQAASTSSPVRSTVLKHCIQKDEKLVPSNKDVTSLDWDRTGELLATGSYDGYARVWTADGVLRNLLGAHKGPIFALKWNKQGNYILSAGVDKTTIVWEPRLDKQLQQFAHHEAPALDVDWKCDDTFASCSTDQKIHVCKLHCDRPIKTFTGHTNEVNAIKWDPSGEILASCSDDMTMKIWTMESDKCVHDLRAHQKEIYTIKWSPRGRLLASASFDTTVRLWDVERGKCVQHLRAHTDPVYSVGFSPDGKYIASGSFDRSVHIWDVNTGKLVQSYVGQNSDGGIFEVCWNCRGDKVAASSSDGTVIVLDVRSLRST